MLVGYGRAFKEDLDVERLGVGYCGRALCEDGFGIGTSKSREGETVLLGVSHLWQMYRIVPGTQQACVLVRPSDLPTVLSPISLLH